VTASGRIPSWEAGLEPEPTTVLPVVTHATLELLHGGIPHPQPPHIN